MVATGAIGWRDLSDLDQHHKESLALPPVKLDRTAASYLIAGLLRIFKFVCPMEELLEKARQNFGVIQILCVCDSASANCRALPRLFSWLQTQAPCLCSFSPCLLHQLARCLVMALERQGVSSSLASWGEQFCMLTVDTAVAVSSIA